MVVVIVQGYTLAGFASIVFLAVFAPWDAGIDDMATKELYHIFPNPTRGELTIETKETGVSHQVMLTDVVGRVVLLGFIQKGTGKFTVQTGTLVPGAYTLSIIPHTGDPYRQVIVIQQ